MNFRIDQWIEIRANFEKMFHGLGTIETSKELLHFTSVEPNVSTGISLSREGKMAANMPLHNLDSTFDCVSFDDSFEELTLTGDGFNYTYRIPNEILEKRRALNQ